MAINGIQQIGIGVSDVDSAFTWYRRFLGMDIPAFDDSGEASLMVRYTGGKPQVRRALLAMNMQGGSGFEIWQFLERKSQLPSFTITLGDLGIFLVRVKSRDVEKTYQIFKSKNADLLGAVSDDPSGGKHFLLKDPFGNIFQIVAGDDWFSRQKCLTGGTCGCLIGVRDIDRARLLYSNILGYDAVVYDKTGIFDDYAALPGGRENVRRILLSHSESRRGSLSRFYGSSQIELVQCLDREPQKIYQDRYWGDLGFIHLCFDVHGMDSIRRTCEAAGFTFTVDSSQSFNMGDASGHFSYIEDSDGTLIEFVETHRIPIMKKFGIYLDLRKRNPEKPLPDWIIKTLSFSRVKD